MLGFTSAMFMLTWALITGPSAGWSSTAFLARFAVSVLLFAFFITVERRRRFRCSICRCSARFLYRRHRGDVCLCCLVPSHDVIVADLPAEQPGHRHAGGGDHDAALRAGDAGAAACGKRLARWLSTRHILSIGLAIVGSGNLALSHYALGGNHLQVGLAMLLLGSGGGLLNGETQKAIMGTVPMDRAGMASGISTTARFSGILLGFTTLGAILATAIRHAAAGAQVPAAYLDRLVAGDIAGAVGTLPAPAAPAARGVAQSTYAAGFSFVFLAAAILACAGGPAGLDRDARAPVGGHGRATVAGNVMRHARHSRRTGRRPPRCGAIR